MRHRVLAALIALPALAACGASTGLTTGRKAPEKRAPTSIHARCPKSDRQKPVSRAPGAEAALVPGHPRAALLCRYTGLNARPRFALVRQRRLTSSASVTRLAHEFDALPKEPHGVAISWPADFGTAVIAFFEYPTLRPDPVSVGLSGCGQVTNGHLTRLAGLAKSPVTGQLEALANR
jgi:hypothetical protein